jgi:succinoglycan biosynthesis transport protein ExoP
MSKDCEVIKPTERPSLVGRYGEIEKRRLTPAPVKAERGSRGSANEDLDLDLRSILQKLFRRWKWILLSTAAMVCLAALVCFFMTPQYKAESKIELLKQDAGGIALSEGSNPASDDSDPLGFALNLQTQLAVLKSDTLAWQVIKELKLVDEKDLPAEPAIQTTSPTQQPPPDSAPDKNAAAVLRRFKRRLTVDTVSGTRLLTVSYMDSNPKMAARIVNQLVSDFVDYSFQVRYNATAKATDWLSRQLVDLKAQVEHSQARAAELEKESGIFGEDEHHNIVVTRLEQLNNEVTTAEADRVLKEALYKLSRSGDPEAVVEMLGTQAGSTTPDALNAAAVLNNLRQQEASLSAEYADASSKYGPAYPRLIQLQQRRASVRASIQAELAKVVSRAKDQYQVAASREAAAKQSFANQKAAAAQMNNKAVDYLIAKHEADSSRELYDHLLGKLKEAGVLAGLHSSQLQVVDPARVPILPARPNVPIYLGLGALAGMVLGVFGVFIADSMDHTMRDLGDIETSTYAPVLGIVPDATLFPVTGQKHSLKSGAAKRPDGPHKALILGLYNSAVAEAFRAVRTSLLLSEPDASRNVFMITSGMSQEGKTFTSINLAAALACNGSKVLLVDADMRRGTLSRVLNQQSGTGLSDLLLEGENQDAYRQIRDVPGLTFVPAGTCPRGPAELLGSPQMTSLIEEWRRLFTYVLIDTPPVLPVTDAVVLSPNVDSVIVVVRFAATTREAVVRTVRLLNDVQAPRVRVLVNAMDFRSPDYRYAGAYGDNGYSEEAQLLVPPYRGMKKESA